LPPLGREIGARWWSKVLRPRWAQDLEKDLWIGQKKKNLILKHVEGTQNGEIWISVIFWFLNVPQ
jgi:hypothetical protein